MKKLSKVLIWFYMHGKRLLFSRSFVMLLCLIPLLIPMLGIATNQDSGMLHIILCSDGTDPTVDAIIQELCETNPVLRFSVSSDADWARHAVQTQKADAAWIFAADFSQKLKAYAAEKSMLPCVELVQREATIPLRIAQEVLFSAIYRDFSYYIYEGFIYASVVSEATLPPSDAALYYNAMPRLDQIVQIEKIGGTPPKEDMHYLIAPVRGLLSVFVLLCTLTAAMFFISDRTRGIYDILSPKKRLRPAVATCFSAAAFSSIVVLVSILLSDFSTGLFHELASLCVLLFTTGIFCSLLCLLFRSSGKLGAFMPWLMIITIALSPIFFNVQLLRPIRLLLPTYYYLQSVYQPDYYVYGAIYFLALSILTWLVNLCVSQKFDRNSVI